MEKVIINKIYHNDTMKDGTPYMNKHGKSYSITTLITEEYPQGIKGFASEQTRSWQEGDEVMIEINDNNGYKNFSPIKEESLRSRITKLEEDVAELQRQINEIPIQGKQFEETIPEPTTICEDEQIPF